MRKFILMTAMLLASATAQAGQSRNLSPVAANDDQPAVTTTTAQPSRAAEVAPPTMQYQAPVAPTPPDPPAPASPSYEVRPAPVTPTTTTEAPPLAQQPTTTTAANPPAKSDAKSDTPRKTAKADRGRRGRGGNWSEARIIGELHRYGIYW